MTPDLSRECLFSLVFTVQSVKFFLLAAVVTEISRTFVIIVLVKLLVCMRGALFVTAHVDV